MSKFYRKIVFPTIKLACRNFHETRICNKFSKQISHEVETFSKININSSYNLSIKSCDLFESPDAANLLRATLYYEKENEIPDFNINIDKNKISIEDKNDIENVKCHLEVPIKSDLKIMAKGDVKFSNFHNDEIEIITLGRICTKDIQSVNVKLHSELGNIRCDGNLLAAKIDITTNSSGDIHLHKLQGKELNVQTDKGSITTDCCYSGNSKFITKKGNLILNNVHNDTDISILEKGDLSMVGFYGTLTVKVNNGNVKLQLSELSGENVVLTNDSENVEINISDEVSENTHILATSGKIKIADNLKDLVKENYNETVVMEEKLTQTNTLVIQTQGNLTIKKLSWADSIKTHFQ